MNSTEDEKLLHKETKRVILSNQWCKNVFLEERERNFGLADNIVDGVSRIVKKYGKIIVLEDDLVVSPSFLRYMNHSLEVYKEIDKVMHISGYWFPVRGKLPETFFLRLGTCWGWGTWQDAWNKLELDAAYLKQEIRKIDPNFERFNLNGTSDFVTQLDENIEGDLKTWAIKWYSTIFINNGLSLHPNKSYVNNIGHDGSGKNSIKSEYYDWKLLNQKVKFFPQPLEYSSLAENKLTKYYLRRKRIRTTNLKSKVKFILPDRVWKFLRKTFLVLQNFRKKRKFDRFLREERFTNGKTKLFSKDLFYLDGPSFAFMSKEIFEIQIYKMKGKRNKPYILDCGANIGLAAIYFCRQYKDAEVICFEPDDEVLKFLKKNISSFDLDNNVKIIAKGLWKEDTNLEFFSEGADGGRIKSQNDKDKLVKIEVTKLSKYINKKVDFLKIDIEGAEYEVLEEIEPKLGLVENIFVEYHSFVGEEQKLPEILSILKRSGFRLNINTPGLKSNSPLFKINVYNNMDAQLNIYGVRD